jgi:hypothetical protein
LPDVLVTEVPEYIFHHILKLESGKLVQDWDLIYPECFIHVVTHLRQPSLLIPIERNRY